LKKFVDCLQCGVVQNATIAILKKKTTKQLGCQNGSRGRDCQNGSFLAACQNGS
jgi:hypothetical protein